MTPDLFNQPDLFHQENNQESQELFDENKKQFSAQCRTVYNLLVAGKRLTTASALLDHGIGDLRRRIKDLKDYYGVGIMTAYVRDGEQKTRFKEYFMDPEFTRKINIR